MQCRARAPVGRHQSIAEGAHAARLRARGGVSWGSTTAPWTPAAPTHLDLPIPWCVSNVRTAADHRRSRWWSSWRYIAGIEPARQRGRSVVVAGNAAVRRGPKARLRRAAARAAAWTHRVAAAGGRTGKGGRGSPLGLSEPKCLIVAFALARDTKCSSTGRLACQEAAAARPTDFDASLPAGHVGLADQRYHQYASIEPSSGPDRCSRAS
jgi:hypothetical protein